MNCIPNAPSVWQCVEFPLLSYRQALNLQHRLVAARIEGRLAANLVIILEHPRVFTLGRRGGRENITVAESVLEKSGIPIVQVERGGNITYHGPGQLVAYPIVRLQEAGVSVAGYVEALEEVMIRTAAAFSVSAGANPANRGVWVGRKKLGSIGITVRRGVSFHGLALNVNTDLEHFCWINPCGLKDVGVTSMAEILARPVPMDRAREKMRRQFEAVFCIRLETLPPEQLEEFLHPRDAC